MDSVIPNDALGGTGAISPSLRDIALNGLSIAVDGAIASHYGLTQPNDRAAVDAYGRYVTAAAPGAKGAGAASQVAGLITSPIAVAIGVAAAIAILVVVLIRK